MFIGHEAKHGEDSEACHEASAAVQAAQHDAVPYGGDGGEKREKRHHTYCKLLINPTPEATQTSMHMSCEERKLSGAKCANETAFSKTTQRKQEHRRQIIQLTV